MYPGADLGSHRKIGKFRILRPLLLAAAIVPLFLERLGTWLAANSIPSAAITDGLIFMAVVMVLTRAAGLFIRSRSISGAGPAPIASPEHLYV
jgi:hypothetical protein